MQEEEGGECYLLNREPAFWNSFVKNTPLAGGELSQKPNNAFWRILGLVSLLKSYEFIIFIILKQVW